jgi:hypothetical protein
MKAFLQKTSAISANRILDPIQAIVLGSNRIGSKRQRLCHFSVGGGSSVEVSREGKSKLNVEHDLTWPFLRLTCYSRTISSILGYIYTNPDSLTVSIFLSVTSVHPDGEQDAYRVPRRQARYGLLSLLRPERRHRTHHHGIFRGQ